MKKLRQNLTLKKTSMKHKINQLTYLLLLLIVVSACKVGKKYNQPDFKLPEQFRGDTVSYAQDSSLFALTSWREFFNDPQLLTLIDSGLANNYDMRTALKNIEIADRNLKRNTLDYLPSVDGNIASVAKQYRSDDFYGTPSSKWYAGKEDNEIPSSLFTYQSQFSTGASFSWELDIWGKIANSKDQLQAKYLDTHEAKNAIQTKLIADIAM